MKPSAAAARPPGWLTGWIETIVRGMEPADLVLAVLKDLREEMRATKAAQERTNARLEDTNARLGDTVSRLDDAVVRLDRLEKVQVETQIRLSPGIIALHKSIEMHRTLLSNLDLRDRVSDHDKPIAIPEQRGTGG